jgi:isoprenylcysteine carboxyl methyltransferase (ICMT) family protein YpbQ
MTQSMIIFCAAAVLLRIFFLLVSIRHERVLKRNGAVEIGAGNTTILALTHVAYYVAALTEGSLRVAPVDLVSIIGFVLYGFGMLALCCVVRLLGRFWTVKLLIARDHQLVMHPLFRWFRHPNYFLNILPELVGFALALHAFATLVIGLLIYAIPLTIRIHQEESAMAAKFDRY